MFILLFKNAHGPCSGGSTLPNVSINEYFQHILAEISFTARAAVEKNVLEFHF